MKDTFHDRTIKMKTFQDILGGSAEIPFKVSKIIGSGNIHQKGVWLNVRDVSGQKETKGLMKVAINDWKDYVSVR
jgi:hypothetical protein